MTELHRCFREFPTTKIDDCCGIGIDQCTGIEKMILALWYQDTDGTECYFDNSRHTFVNYCPYCGLKSTGIEI